MDAGDSGCGLSTSGARRNLGWSLCDDESPTSDGRGGRKRKSCRERARPTPRCDVTSLDLSFGCEFAESTPLCGAAAGDELRLSSSLERCSLDDPVGGKRSRKSSSAPTTPQRPATEPAARLHKCRSFELTPSRPVRTRLGTPEKNEILYPRLARVRPQQRPRRTRPKRRLFASRDFVHLFCRASGNSQLVRAIFSHLSDSDLESVHGVSALWRGALRADPAAYRRYRQHVRRRVVCKENVPSGRSAGKPPRPVSPASPARDNFVKFVRAGRALPAWQRLAQCPRCCRPAVREAAMVQCTGPSCLYLWCGGCLWGSSAGPETFRCNCPGTRPARLSDISNSPRHAPPDADLGPDAGSFFSDVSLSASGCSGAAASSGYHSLSDCDGSAAGAYLQPQPQPQLLDAKAAVLNDFNKGVAQAAARAPVDAAAVAASAAVHRAVLECVRRGAAAAAAAAYEPSSPPKVDAQIVGSRKSRRSLRRLNF